MQFRVIVVTDPPTARPPVCDGKQTGPITIHCATASAQCKKKLEGCIHDERQFKMAKRSQGLLVAF